MINSKNNLFLGDYKLKRKKNPNAMEEKAEGIIFIMAQISFFFFWLFYVKVKYLKNCLGV